MNNQFEIKALFISGFFVSAQKKRFVPVLFYDVAGDERSRGVWVEPEPFFCPAPTPTPTLLYSTLLY